MAGCDDLESVRGVLRCVEQAGDQGRVAVSEIVEEIGDDAFGPLLLVPALLLASPASGIPGLPTIGGLLMVLIAFQVVIGCKHLWLPDFIRRRTIARGVLDTATNFLNKPARFIDRTTRKRLTLFTEGPLGFVPAVMSLAIALLVPLFEIVPMSATLAGVAVSFFALAMVTKDGLLVLIGLAVTAGTMGLALILVS